MGITDETLNSECVQIRSSKSVKLTDTILPVR